MLKTRIKATWFFVLLLGGWLADNPPSQGGTLVKAIQQSYSQKNDYTYITIYIDQGKIKADVQGPKINGSFFYDQLSSQVDWADHAQKTCMEFTTNDQAMVKSFIHLGAAAFEAGLKNEKNPRKRKETEETKRSLQEFLDHPVEPAERGVTFDGFTCDRYETRDKKKKTSESWWAPPTSTPMAVVDFNTCRSFVDLVLGLAGEFLTAMGVDIQKVEQLPFFQELPIGELGYVKGKPDGIFRILSIQPGSFAPGSFALPANYTKQSLIELMTKAMEAGTQGQQAPKK